jgi:Glycosyltransferase family 87
MPRARALAVPAFVALTGALLLGWLRLLTPALSDYEAEAEPSILALRAGDIAGFFEHAPAYGGSLLLRAPFALLPEVWGGGDTAVFRSLAVPCLVASAVLGAFLWARAADLGHRPGARWIALGICAMNPLTLWAYELGHPEELLGGALSVGAVVAAGARRPVLAGLMLGLAVANKQWAVLAALPMLLALPTGREQLRAAVAAAVPAVALLLPFVLAGSGAVAQTQAVATASSPIFQPWQIWWFFGPYGTSENVVALFGGEPGWRVPPSWFGPIGRLFVVAVPLALSLAVARRWRGRPWHDALALLAFAYLLRCLLDPWNVLYYEVPFLFALVAWEINARRDLPVISLAATFLSWVTLTGWGDMSPDLQSATFLAWTLPLAVTLGAVVWRVRLGVRRRLLTS